MKTGMLCLKVVVYSWFVCELCAVMNEFLGGY